MQNGAFQRHTTPALQPARPMPQYRVVSESESELTRGSTALSRRRTARSLGFAKNIVGPEEGESEADIVLARLYF